MKLSVECRCGARLAIDCNDFGFVAMVLEEWRVRHEDNCCVPNIPRKMRMETLDSHSVDARQEMKGN